MFYWGRSSQLEETDLDPLRAVSSPGKDCNVCRWIVNCFWIGLLEVKILGGMVSTALARAHSVQPQGGRRGPCGFTQGVWRRGRRGRYPEKPGWVWKRTRNLVLSHQPACIGSVSIAPGEPWGWPRARRTQLPGLGDWSLLPSQSPLSSAPARNQPTASPVPLTGHPTLPQCLRIPSASGINSFNSCLPWGLQISVLFLAWIGFILGSSCWKHAEEQGVGCKGTPRTSCFPCPGAWMCAGFGVHCAGH